MLRTKKSGGLGTGRHLLAWILGQADVWYLLYRCAHYVSKTHNGEDDNTNLSILNNFFSLEEEARGQTDCLNNNDNIFNGDG